MTTLFLTLLMSLAHASDPASSTISECIASTTSKAQLLECMKSRNADMDTEEDHAVVKCLLKGDDKKIYWYEDCIRG